MEKITLFGRLGLSQQVRSFQSSSVVSASLKAKRLMKAQKTRTLNFYKQHMATQKIDRTDPVMGRDATFLKRIDGKVGNPNHLAMGYKLTEVEKLLYGAQKQAVSEGQDWKIDSIIKTEEKKRNAVLTVLNMQNFNKEDEKKLAIKFAREEFARTSEDTGSSEVQAAVMTIKIKYLLDHIKDNKKDLQNIRKLRILVQQRQNILKYLKRDDPEKYFFTIEKLGLTDHAVTKEFNLDRKYFQDYKVWGDKQLVKVSGKVRDQQSETLRRVGQAQKLIKRIQQEKVEKRASDAAHERIKRNAAEAAAAREAAVLASQTVDDSTIVVEEKN